MMLLKFLLQVSFAVGVIGMAVSGAGTGQGGDGNKDVTPGKWKEHNCKDIEKRRIKPLIDCSYSWENCPSNVFQNTLLYRIRIDPIGDTSPEWCEILMDKINGLTKRDFTDWFECNRTYNANGIGNGLMLTWPVTYPWPEGGDFRSEIETAIHWSMCSGGPALTNWVNEGCYRESVCKSRYWTAENEREPSDGKNAEVNIYKSLQPKAISLSTLTPIVKAQKIGLPAAQATGVDPDFTCAFVDPNQGLTTDVDCSYYYDPKVDHLRYKVDIHPTGQDSTRWCDQLIAAIRQRCIHGNGEDRYVATSCKTNVFESNLGKGMSIEFDAKSWIKGERNRHCTRKAIESTTCGIPTVFRNGGCYQSRAG